MKAIKNAQDVIDQEEALKVQPELELMHTVVMDKGFLPNVICIMYTHQKQITWFEYRDRRAGFGCPDPDGCEYTEMRQSTVEVEPELTLATFDEKSLKRHVEQWGTKVHDRESVYRNYDHSKLMDRFETWLTYEKIEFQQLEGVRMYPDERTIELDKQAHKRKERQKQQDAAKQER